MLIDKISKFRNYDLRRRKETLQMTKEMHYNKKINQYSVIPVETKIADPQLCFSDPIVQLIPTHNRVITTQNKHYIKTTTFNIWPL